MTLFGADPITRAAADALDALDLGEPVVERSLLDLKEEAGRRDRDGALRPGSPRSEVAAEALAGEVACMANSPTGGALIVGVGDDGTPLGTELDIEWLRLRLFQLLRQGITTDISEARVRGTRVLIIRCPAALEPVRWRGRVTWRVGDQCQEIDAASWHDRRARGWGYDWSNRPSGVDLDAVRAEAEAIARRFLSDSGDPRAEELADLPVLELLRRLHAVDASGELTNAGALMFVGRTTPALDYIRRPGAGADSELRVNEPGRSLLEELSEVFAAIRAHNPEIHIQQGLVIGRVRTLPERAVREAIVNGVAHREWSDPAPTTIEHIGRTLRVTSPGGFYGGVRPENIINHPATSRNKDLSLLLADLRIAERQGVGVDRMYADMIRYGHPTPSIDEVDGGSVRTVLAAERPDLGWVAWLTRTAPDVRGDLRLLMASSRLLSQYWTDPEDLAPFLQVTLDEARQTLERLEDVQVGGSPLATTVQGVPTAVPGPVLAVSRTAIESLAASRRESGSLRPEPTRREVARSYAAAHGRISTTELGSILGADPTNLGRTLRALEDEGTLEPSRANRRGAGFYYRFRGTNAQT